MISWAGISCDQLKNSIRNRDSTIKVQKLFGEGTDQCLVVDLLKYIMLAFFTLLLVGKWVSRTYKRWRTVYGYIMSICEHTLVFLICYGIVICNTWLVLLGDAEQERHERPGDFTSPGLMKGFYFTTFFTLLSMGRINIYSKWIYIFLLSASLNSMNRLPLMVTTTSCHSFFFNDIYGELAISFAMIIAILILEQQEEFHKLMSKQLLGKNDHDVQHFELEGDLLLSLQRNLNDLRIVEVEMNNAGFPVFEDGKVGGLLDTEPNKQNTWSHDDKNGSRLLPLRLTKPGAALLENRFTSKAMWIATKYQAINGESRSSCYLGNLCRDVFALYEAMHESKSRTLSRPPSCT